MDPRSYGWKPLTHRLANAFGPVRMRRNVGRIHQRLVDEKRVAWLSEEGQLPPEPGVTTDGALARSVERVKALFD